ncbi:MAG: nucleotidyltransferase family protein [Blastocatellia bacterium]|nr:nucleotidyltransferase family protein [Blastocatellia bacterium]MCS7156396.1 nucleotidyltransferase family protein [Blastocatellia bacterium]MCX7751253.1 nucleotidyltransferase family protein [Blastocatellia bacterium]MDW8168965.1 nucleotidyltransferase family protein [Acidobacteriota bacterium]MDW8256725.1 nucleotidyltransferase family protein [Acidobacteriota bacterium]
MRRALLVSSMFVAKGQGQKRGALIARALTGCWRATPPPWDLRSEELDDVGQLLLDFGVAGLVWHRLRVSRAEATRWTFRFHQAARACILHALQQERWLVRALACFTAAGIEPILGKGWAAAQSYAAPNLRPYGDADLYIPVEHAAKAFALLNDPQFPPCSVDLHVGFAELDDRTPEQLYARSRRIPLEGTMIRVFGPEDHLRLMALHLLRHGARRPLWLCDVAAALETRPPDFDWEYFLSGDRQRSEWVMVALALAHQLLGARIEDVPFAIARLPQWIPSTVLREWEKPYHPRVPLEVTFRSFSLFVRELIRKWPNPIEATVTARGRFDEGPRFPLQLADCVIRAGRWLRRIGARRYRP